MKRNIQSLIILVLAALGSAIQAQRPTGDTLTSLPNDYLVTSSLDWFSDDSSDWFFAPTPHFIIPIEYYQLRDANHILGRDFGLPHRPHGNGCRCRHVCLYETHTQHPRHRRRPPNNRLRLLILLPKTHSSRHLLRPFETGCSTLADGKPAPLYSRSPQMRWMGGYH